VILTLSPGEAYRENGDWVVRMSHLILDIGNIKRTIINFTLIIML
jgi:hypothetical protein